MVRTDLLKQKALEYFDTLEEFADAIGISRTTLHYRMTNQREWTMGEARKIKEVLKLKSKDISHIFFE